MFIIDKINGQTNINVASFVLFEHRKEKEEEEINVHIELLAQQKKKQKEREKKIDLSRKVVYFWARMC